MPQLGHTWSTSFSPSTQNGMRQQLWKWGDGGNIERAMGEREGGDVCREGEMSRGREKRGREGGRNVERAKGEREGGDI